MNFTVRYKNLKGELCKHIYATLNICVMALILFDFSTIKDVRKANKDFVVHWINSFNHHIYSKNMHLWFEKKYQSLFSCKIFLLENCVTTLDKQQEENSCVSSLTVVFWIMYILYIWIIPKTSLISVFSNSVSHQLIHLISYS